MFKFNLTALSKAVFVIKDDLVASVQLAWPMLVLMALLASSATATITAAAVKASASAGEAILEADLAVERAKQGVPPTFWQSLYGVTVRPPLALYGGAQSIDGRAYSAVTSTFGSASQQSTEAPTVSVVAQAPVETK